MLLYTAAEFKSGYLEREEGAYITEPEREWMKFQSKGERMRQEEIAGIRELALSYAFIILETEGRDHLDEVVALFITKFCQNREKREKGGKEEGESY